MLNLFVAIILETFYVTSKAENSTVKTHYIDAFIHTW